MKLTSLIAAGIVLASASASADVIYGTVVQDLGCAFLVEDVLTGLKYQPDDFNPATMPLGTQVTINGTPSTCGSICFNLDFCVFGASTTLGWNFDECGTLIQDFAGCILIELPTGEKYIPDNGAGGFAIGSTVHITGTFDPSCASICGPNDGCIWNAITDTNCGGPTLGTNYCVSAPNSASSAGSAISASGSDSISAANITLMANNIPTGMAAMFFYGSTQTQTPWGNGMLCVGGGLQRIQPVLVESGGGVQTVIDFGLHASSFAAMGTVEFQLNYRDTPAGGAGFNSSNGLEIVFLP